MTTPIDPAAFTRRGMPSTNPYGHLECPACGFDYTHINRVSMVDAAGHALSITGVGEDAHCTMTVDMTSPEGLHTIRRQAVGITIDCEGCNCQSVLVFLQHKGQTEVEYSVQQVEQPIEN
jgi:hypothetical protein